MADTEPSTLTHHEGALLAEVGRHQPVTAYRLVSLYGMDPVASLNQSKGQVYPGLKRLEARGFIQSKAVSGDKRQTQRWSITEAGEAALRHWVRNIRPDHLLIEDPVRTKLMSLDRLSRDEQLAWIDALVAALDEKQEEVDNYASTVDVPFKPFVHANANQAIATRRAWLQELRKSIADGCKG